VLDARLRGRHGYLTALLVIVGGPLVAALIALVVRRHVRKVSPRFRAAPPLAVVVFLIAVVLVSVSGFWALNRVGFTDLAPSRSMEPRIRVGDRVVIAPILLARPHRGDVVAAGPFPGAVAVTGSRRVVEIGRILGLPGDWIGATADRGLYICSAPPRITHLIVPSDVCAFPDETAYVSNRTAVFGPVEVPPGTVFLLGDNRDSLDDSRTFGPVPRSALIGPVVMTIWPLSRLAVR
jgi:signal peptidase I